MAVRPNMIFCRPSIFVFSTRKMCWNFSGITNACKERQWQNLLSASYLTVELSELRFRGIHSLPCATWTHHFAGLKEGRSIAHAQVSGSHLKKNGWNWATGSVWRGPSSGFPRQGTGWTSWYRRGYAGVHARSLRGKFVPEKRSKGIDWIPSTI